MILGLDIAKRDFHAALSDGNDRPRMKAFPNKFQSIRAAFSWLESRSVESVHACLEATGRWSEALATELHKHGHKVTTLKNK